MKTEFSRAVYEVVRAIPRGRTLTYKEVAEKAGRPRAFRAVGTILSQNFDPTIPCHRVVRSDGNPGEYNRGKQKKREILESEGVLLSS